MGLRDGLALAPRLSGRAVATSSAAIVTGLGLLTVVVAVRGGWAVGSAVGGPAWLLGIGVLALTVTTISAWSLPQQAPSAGVGLCVAAAGAVLPLWASVWWLPAAGRAALLALPPLVVAGAFHTARRWGDTDARTSGGEHAVWACVAGAVLVHLAAYNPFADPACLRTCLDVGVPLQGVLTSRDAVMWTAVLTVAGGAAALLSGRPPAWRAPALVRTAAQVAVVLASATAAARFFTWGQQAASTVLPLLDLAAVSVLAVGLAAHTRRTVRTRVAVDRVLEALSAPASGPDRFGAGITAVHFSMPQDPNRWIDPEGRDVADPPATNRCVLLRDGTQPVVRLVLRRRTDAAQALAELRAGSRLALHNARLSAVARAQLADVQASQRRVVAMADAERHRIERDLHDGAQQRLVSAAFHLRIAHGRVEGATAAVLEQADRRIKDALAHLRRLAHGMFPTAVVEEGLEVALGDLVASSHVPAALDVTTTGHVDPDAARTAYHTVAGVMGYVLRPSRATRLRIQVRQDAHALTVEAHVHPAGALVLPAQMTAVADRVGAAGGDVTVTQQGDSAVVLKAVIPCAS